MSTKKHQPFQCYIGDRLTTLPRLRFKHSLTLADTWELPGGRPGLCAYARTEVISAILILDLAINERYGAAEVQRRLSHTITTEQHCSIKVSGSSSRSEQERSQCVVARCLRFVPLATANETRRSCFSVRAVPPDCRNRIGIRSVALVFWGVSSSGPRIYRSPRCWRALNAIFGC
jgi:hypothetical protein